MSKDELFPPGSVLAGESFMINELSLGCIFDFARVQALTLGVGGLASTYSYPATLIPAYGDRPTSWMLFVRARL